MNAFVAMRRFMIQNAAVLMRIAHLEKHQIETDEKIDLILDKIEEQSPKLLPEQVFATGCVWDAWTYISDLVRSARKRIVLIDNYVDDRVLSMLTKRADGVTATIHTRYNEQFLTDLKKHNTQYPEIVFIQLPHRNHDRFLIIDDKVYLLGASMKDIGAGLCAVTEMSIEPEVILGIISKNCYYRITIDSNNSIRKFNWDNYGLFGIKKSVFEDLYSYLSSFFLICFAI